MRAGSGSGVSAAIIRCRPVGVHGKGLFVRFWLDTCVDITGNGNIILRFRTDKPGPWFLHCHVGLGSVIGAGFDEVGKVVHPTDAWALSGLRRASAE
ncbi:hypothetical protein B0H13DRAFT_2307084 [Mycena leptocephala]|nr:hypothetical protein B0H13DRAFT_2307084 [Mycena leptocephala]